MKKSQELSERMIRYLSSLGHGVWVTKKLLSDQALKNKYSTGAIRDAFGDLDNTAEIGYRYHEGEVRYCWYKLTDEQKERHKKQRALFDSINEV
jgi:hypothetical protein